MKLAKYSTKFSKKQIILLSIPVFFSNLAIPLVGIVDTGLMGNLGATKYLAASKTNDGHAPRRRAGRVSPCLALSRKRTHV